MNRSRALAIRSEGAAPNRLLVILNMLAVLLVLFTLAACGGGKEQAANTSEAQEPVVVTLAGHDINMPESLPSGFVTFEVTNEGDSLHGFEIAGPGTDEKVEGIPPGETRTLQVDLQPGTYRVYCPVADHGKTGMQLALKVVPRDEAT
jgi:Cupredoxin-like domain